MHLLHYGADHGHCQHPSFDYTIVNEARQQCLPEIEEEEQKQEPTNETVMEETKEKGNKPHSVVQIDTNTLQPIKLWKSASEVQRVLGIKNIKRAIERKGVAGGYHWCYAGEEEHFKPSEIQKEGRVLRQEKPVETVRTTDVTLTMYSDQQLADELARRGFKGVMERMQTLKIGES